MCDCDWAFLNGGGIFLVIAFGSVEILLHEETLGITCLRLFLEFIDKPDVDGDIVSFDWYSIWLEDKEGLDAVEIFLWISILFESLCTDSSISVEASLKMKSFIVKMYRLSKNFTD